MIVFRPYLSDNGPQISMLRLRNTKKTARVRFTKDTEVFSCALIEGNAGKYRSVENAGKADKTATNISIDKSDSCLDANR